MAIVPLVPRHGCFAPQPGEFGHGVQFKGSKGWIFVTRGNIQASEDSIISEPLPFDAKKLYASSDHMRNFFECIRSRKDPICDVEIGHRSVSVCHLGVIALRTGKTLKWNPEKEEFVGDAEVNKWLARPMRKPYDYSMV